jgi:hypothetical protein
MKKLLSLVLTLGMTFSLCICTASAAQAQEPEETTSSGVYLAFTGDQHGETEGYQAWIEDQQAVYGDDFVLLSYSGDICEKNWEQDVFDGFKDVLDSLVPGKYNVTTGNQEFKSGAPGDSWDDLGDGFTRLGEVTATEDYIVYDIGSAQESMGFPQSDIDALAAYLDAAPADVPIFVLSHYPLHLSVATDSHSIPGGDHRQSDNNAALIEVLNQHPNVIFLWGHNHTFQDPRYGTIRPAGSKFTYDYDNAADKVEINFTYANYGSFCRGDTYGVMAQVERTARGVEVTMYYIDTNEPMTDKDSAVITVAADGTVTATVTDGTGIDMDEILAMSGYAADPNFEAEF